MSQAMAGSMQANAVPQRRGRLGAAGWVVGAYLLGRMFMVFNSGKPQPADIAVGGLLLFILRPHYLRRLTRAAPEYVAFVSWVALLSICWGLIRGTTSYAMHIIFQVYNLVLVMLVLGARVDSPDRFDRTVATVVTVAAWIQLAVLLGAGTTFRAVGTFNNSNQLAYWSICTLSLYLAVQPNRAATRDLMTVMPLAYAELVSTSRAGFVAFSLLTVGWLYDLLRHSRFRVAYGAVLLFGAVIATTLPAFGDYLFELEVSDHIGNRFAKDSSADEVTFRNTDRISSYPAYAIFGAGEGDLSRFPHSLRIEIHSTPMTILFSYGIIGVLTFGLFVFRLLQGANRIQKLSVTAMLLYSVTHNGIRFTFFWITLAVIVAQPWVAAAKRTLSTDTEPA